MHRSAAHADVYHAVADPTRRAILDRLRRGGSPVSELAAGFRMTRPAVSKHLGILRQAGLVQDRRNGRQTHYSARPQALGPLVDWMSHYGTFWRQRLDRLEDLLNRMDQ